jgi:hypothetical protein
MTFSAWLTALNQVGNPAKPIKQYVLKLYQFLLVKCPCGAFLQKGESV